jgi:uncharacterized protein DUF6391
MGPEDLVFNKRVRQNHALEHATVTLLTRADPRFSVSARANARGFTIFADLDPRAVRATGDEALLRLRRGEVDLAIHPNCGTNLAVGFSVMMAGALVSLTALRARTRLATAIASSLAGFAVARPLGQVLQRHVTTLAEVDDLHIADVVQRRILGRPVVEVLTTRTR